MFIVTEYAAFKVGNNRYAFEQYTTMMLVIYVTLNV